jgi:hypothetical protein
MPFDPNSNENNRNLQAAGFKAFPTVDARGAAGAEPPPGLTSMVPMKKVPTAAGEQVRGDPNLGGGLKMPRTNSGK